MRSLTSAGGSNVPVSQEVPAYLSCPYLEGYIHCYRNPKGPSVKFQTKMRDRSLVGRELDFKTDESEKFF